MNKIKDEIKASILEQCKKIDNNFYSKYACRNSQAIRKYHYDKSIYPFSYDTDLIIHSLSYTRYIDKTQVFFLFENDHITHRVLHVQLVSKIARNIGRFLGLNEDLIEAISLAHDIGHSPYGHVGEKFLNKICIRENIGCFVHNAQSVRFLIEMENNGEGLNISLQVLDGILCHNGEIIKNHYAPKKDKSWDDFMFEYKKCLEDENYSKQLIPMTLEACVVRISDVIAYIGRDIEDAIIVGLISREEIPEIAREKLGSTNNEIMENLILDLLNNSYNCGYIQFSDEIYEALQVLFDFNYKKIYTNPKITEQNSKIERMFNLLFEKYMEDLTKPDESSYIYKWAYGKLSKRYTEQTDLKRIVIDYIAGMTDDFFNKEFKEYMFPKSYGYKIQK